MKQLVSVILLVSIGFALNASAEECSGKVSEAKNKFQQCADVVQLVEGFENSGTGPFNCATMENLLTTNDCESASTYLDSILAYSHEN